MLNGSECSIVMLQRFLVVKMNVESLLTLCSIVFAGVKISES